MASNLTTIIGQFLHPPIGLCKLESLPGNPYSGLNALQRIRGPVDVDAFGIQWLITAYPAGYGVSPRAGVNVFDRPVIDIAVRHQLIDATIQVTQEINDRRATGYVMFQESFPHLIDVELAPGVSADLAWVLVL